MPTCSYSSFDSSSPSSFEGGKVVGIPVVTEILDEVAVFGVGLALSRAMTAYVYVVEVARPVSGNDVDNVVVTGAPFRRTVYVIGAVPPDDAVHVKEMEVFDGTPVRPVGVVN